MFVNNTHSLVYSTVFMDELLECCDFVCMHEFMFTDIYSLTLTRSKHAHTEQFKQTGGQFSRKTFKLTTTMLH